MTDCCCGNPLGTNEECERCRLIKRIDELEQQCSKLLKVGDIVSLAKWDATNPPGYAFGNGCIIALRKCRSQSGIVADIKTATNRVMTGLDVAWLTKVEADE